MIRQIHIHQFGGLKERELSLQRGLNLILGDNEAGKSSFVSALFFLFFQNARYLKTHKEFIERALPYPGGDAARASAVFTAKGREYEIEKYWHSKNARVSLRTGESLETDEKTVSAQMRELLSAGEGTYAHLIFSDRRNFRRIFEELRKDKESLHEIRDLLKKLGAEASGFSIEAYRARLSEEYRACVSHWDAEKGRPEGNRGLENPYRKEVGGILAAYYEKESLRQKIEEAEEAEQSYAEISARLTEVRVEIEKAGGHLRQMEEEESLLRKYVQVRDLLLNIRQELSLFHESYVSWPLLEAEQKSLEIQLLQIREKREKAEEELGLIQRKRQLDLLIEKMESAERLEAEILRRQEEKAELGRYGPENKRLYRQLRESLRLCRAKLEAAAVQLHVRSGEIRLLTVEGEEITLCGGERHRLQGYGKIRFGEDGEIEVRSLHLDVDEVKREQEKSREDLQRLHEDFGTEEEEKISANFLRCAELEKSLQDLNLRLELLQGEFDREELCAEMEKFKGCTLRQRAEAEAELSELREKESFLVREKDRLSYRLEDLLQRFETKEKLLSLLLEKSHQEKTLQKEIETLSLSEELKEEDAEQFSERLRLLRKSEKEQLLEESRLQSELMRCEIRRPEVGAEEMRQMLAEAQGRYEQQIRRAAELRRIQEVFEQTCRQFEQESDSGLQKTFSENLSFLTGGKYQASDWEEIDRIQIQGKERPLHLKILSEGTFEALLLAFRLAAVEHLMPADEAFIILDDCLLTMDEHRRKRAAALIREKAEKMQVILMTCSREIAELFGGQIHEMTKKR